MAAILISSSNVLISIFDILIAFLNILIFSSFTRYFFAHINKFFLMASNIHFCATALAQISVVNSKSRSSRSMMMPDFISQIKSRASLWVNSSLDETLYLRLLRFTIPNSSFVLKNLGL